ncbi:hypothetical protein C3B59_00640 [Cryobacterium zongtaii]|uniref:Uncharacterized protein n=1 Tax=Cryobacterium zongtaii TaxID=1259217 RepID=A0A2S3ZQB8_9MICO|nr:hypothetical protein C3B59_00640 [Cryobacterium zongtaii]
MAKEEYTEELRPNSRLFDARRRQIPECADQDPSVADVPRPPPRRGTGTMPAIPTSPDCRCSLNDSQPCNRGSAAELKAQKITLALVDTLLLETLD